MPESDSDSANSSKYIFWAINLLLGIAFLTEVSVTQLPPAVDAVLILLAAAASIAALNRQLPLQNIVVVAAVSALIGGVAHGVSSRPDLSLPFGPIVFEPAIGAQIFSFVPWTIPFLWIVAIFNARGTARLILRPWRKVKNYGYWLMGLTALLATAFDFALEPFASYHVKYFWRWQPTKIPITWEGATLLNFLGWACVSLFIMMLITPSLIRKQPGSRSKPDIHPFAVWLGALVLFAVGSARAGLWLPVGVDAGIALVTGVFAIRGIKW